MARIMTKERVSEYIHEAIKLASEIDAKIQVGEVTGKIPSETANACSEKVAAPRCVS